MKKDVFFTAILLAFGLLLAACPDPLGDEDMCHFSIIIGYDSETLPWDESTRIEDLTHDIYVYANSEWLFNVYRDVKANQTVNTRVAITARGRPAVSVTALKDGVVKAQVYMFVDVKSGSNGTFMVTMKEPRGSYQPGGGGDPPGDDDDDRSGDDGGDPPVDDDDPPDADTLVTFNSVTADGSVNTQTTTQLTLTFSQPITGLTASDITLSGVTVTKGTFSGSNPYTLQIGGITAEGNLSVAVAKAGYVISGSPKTAAIHYNSNGTEGLEYTLINGGTEYSVSKGTVTGGAVDIPAVYNTLPVTEIAGSAFAGTGITSVTIPASVTTIGSAAFQDCTGITGITIPNNVTTIGANAFNGCIGLSSITIPASVTTINDSAFRACTGLNDITIGSGVTTIGANVFLGCNNLTDITINTANVTSYNGAAFSSDNNWKNIFQAAATVTFNANIQNFAFYGDTLLTSVTINPGVTTIGDYAFQYCNNSGFTTITIPSTVTTIGNNAFQNCINLTGVTIGSSVTSIGNGAFQNTALTAITIPANVTTIGQNAFAFCAGLTSVTFAAGSNITSANFGTIAFPQDNANGDNLRTAYLAAGAGTYTRSNNTASDWGKPITFSSISANGDSTHTTTQLTLNFSAAIPGLTAADITLTGVTGVIKGTLSVTGATYTLGISGFTSGGNLTATVAKTGYTISPASRDTTIYYYNLGTAGITIDVAQIVDGAPIITDPITISKSGVNKTYDVTVSNPSQYTSITWEIAGAGVIYANPPVTESGATFQLNAADSRYNALGGNSLVLTVMKGGMQYQTTIPFTIAP